mmetsp:Transcript_10611/g.17366  ORF Transcript_10611/g.17366 Transcript_10611/m.17366 type:complete len:201 (+) Transcript_10611:68-670(+)
MGILTLVEQLTFYQKYHSDKINQIIHIFCVPIILWTILVWLAYIPIVPNSVLTDALLRKLLAVNGGLLLALFYTIYYVILDPLAGVTFGIFVHGLWVAANLFLLEEGPSSAWKMALGMHMISWILQFIGHGVFEKRSPALLESVGQAFLMAPLFVWLEVLFMMGYSPPYRSQVQLAVAAAKAAEGKAFHSETSPLLSNAQ